MSNFNRLGREFFNKSTVEAARSLLGVRLVRTEQDHRVGGVIVETEAYHGETDLGCHAKAGVTPRTKVMYGPPGHIYVYFNYGMHWLLNFVAEPEGFPAAVLIRALWPDEGVDLISQRRKGKPRSQWANGPGKLTQALGIDRRFNGADLFAPDALLFLEEGIPVPDSSITIGPRVGLNSVSEPWKSIPWRFQVEKAALPSLLNKYCKTNWRRP